MTSQNDDDDDYMSDSLLNQIPDTRPGLVFDRKVARKHELEKKHQMSNESSKRYSIKELEEKNREEGLSKSTLTEENKGFNLMLKMGFKPGEALGKSQQGAEKPKLIEPINVVIKTDRQGLGIDEKKRENAEKLRELAHAIKRSETELTASYLNRKKSNFLLRKLRYSLHKCQRVCYQLDSSNDVKQPVSKWYWPAPQVEKLSIETEREPETVSEPVDTKLNEDDQDQIADRYKFCETKSDQGDLDPRAVYENRLEKFLNDEETPATTSQQSNENTETEKNREENEEDEELVLSKKLKLERTDAEKKRNDDYGDDLSDVEAVENAEDSEEMINKKCDAICLYLRSSYLYCVWCAARYETETEIDQLCPGLTQQAHELDE